MSRVASSQRDRHWRGAAATSPRWDGWQNAGVINGIHHLGFTVRDAEASAAWYVEVLGFRRVGEHQAPNGTFRKVFLRHDNLPSRIGLTEHRARSKDVFDETRIGLDRLFIGVPPTAPTSTRG